MIYMWWPSEHIKDKEVGCYERETSPNRFLLYRSKFLDKTEFSPTPRVKFFIPKKRVLTFDCLENTAGTPLVNQKIRTLIEDIAPNEVQFMDADLLCSDGTLSNTYFYLNVLNVITGIDHEKSVYTKIKGLDDILSFKYLVYKKNALNGFHIARDSEYHSNLLVNEEIKAAFDKEKIIGVDLIRPEEIKWL